MLNASIYIASILSQILFSFTFLLNVMIIKSIDENFFNIFKESILNSCVFRESAVFKKDVLSKEASQKKTNLLLR